MYPPADVDCKFSFVDGIWHESFAGVESFAGPAYLCRIGGCQDLREKEASFACKIICGKCIFCCSSCNTIPVSRDLCPMTCLVPKTP